MQWTAYLQNMDTCAQPWKHMQGSSISGSVVQLRTSRLDGHVLFKTSLLNRTCVWSVEEGTEVVVDGWGEGLSSQSLINGKGQNR